MTPLVICIVGKKKSGKTTTTVGLIKELVGRGHTVGSAKHGHHFDIDQEGKDSFRHRHDGGAVTTVLSGPNGVAMVGDWPQAEESLEVLVTRHLAHVDIVIAEGYKSSSYPRFEVYRRARHDDAIYGTEEAEGREYLAVLTDVPDFRAEVPVIDMDDPHRFTAMADMVEARLAEEAE